MNAAAQNLFVIADFTADNLSGALANDPSWPLLSCTISPFGEIERVVLEGFGAGTPPTCALVWTRPEQACAAFQELLASGRSNDEAIAREVDRFADHVTTLAGRVATVLVVAWTST